MPASRHSRRWASQYFSGTASHVTSNASVAGDGSGGLPFERFPFRTSKNVCKNAARDAKNTRAAKAALQARRQPDGPRPFLETIVLQMEHLIDGSSSAENICRFLKNNDRKRTRKAGRGIVICGGGLRYFTCAWVCIHLLRHFGSNLPIELWYLGPKECSARMKKLVEPLAVTCVDANTVAKRVGSPALAGYELKAFALYYTHFQHVLLLDADNAVTRNPEYLFESREFQTTGAIFWPDYDRLEPDRPIWHLCGVRYRDEPEFESGQIFVDSERHRDALSLALFLNEH